LRGYADALRSAGLDIDDIAVVQAHPADGSAPALILDAAPDATAILAMADMHAIAVMAEAQHRGKVVPRDLSVIGFNDIPEAARAAPPLTTIDARGAERGRVAARMLIDPDAPRRQDVRADLIVRASTAPAPSHT
jgi:DNA-binding LacI/PurR family transcriptional regulator